MSSLSLRNEALLLLDHRGAILDTAREVSDVLRENGLSGAIIGGIAVVLHGYVRTTIDVDVFVASAAEAIAESLLSRGFAFDAERREFRKGGIPVHLVLPDQAGKDGIETVEIDGIKVASLPELIGMKLRSGRKNLLRSIDLADVVGLARHHGLDGRFASKLDKEIRPEFRKIVRALAEERGG